MKPFISIVSVAFLALISVNALAQPATTIIPLKIGDTIPDEMWDAPLQVMNHLPANGKKTATLNEHRGKLIILDFWGSGCAVCIAAFPKMDSLQRQFGESIQIMLVNSYETQQELDRVNESRIKRAGKPIPFPDLPSITGDTVLGKWFPRVAVPHYVWIGGDGTVLAITNGRNFNAANIHEYLNEGRVALKEKKDFALMDESRPLFLDDRVDAQQVQQYSLLIKGRVGNFRRPPYQENRYFIKSKPMYTLYSTAAEKIIPMLRHGRQIIDVDDINSLRARDSVPNSINSDELYIYDFIVPEASADSLYHYAIADLNRYTDYYGRIEKRDMLCYVLVNTGAENQLVSQGGEYRYSLRISKEFTDAKQALRNGTWDNFLIWVSNTVQQTDEYRVLVDETGFTENIDIEFRDPVTDMLSLKRQLQLYGLDIIEAEREIEVFVLSDKKKE